jgi:ssDNA-specific exonuclease RecJ
MIGELTAEYEVAKEKDFDTFALIDLPKKSDEMRRLFQNAHYKAVLNWSNLVQ